MNQILKKLSILFVLLSFAMSINVYANSNYDESEVIQYASSDTAPSAPIVDEDDSSEDEDVPATTTGTTEWVDDESSSD